MTRWWAVALLSLSVGLNLGLAVAVLQQRFGAPPAPTVVVVPSPAGAFGAAAPPVGNPPAALGARAPYPGVEGLDQAPGARAAAQPPPEPAPVREVAPPIRDERRPAPPPSRAEGPRAIGDELEGEEPPPPELGDFRGPPQARLEEVAARLGVPEKDRPAFIALQRRFLSEARVRRIELESARREMRAELIAPSPDRERLRTLVESSARAQAALERTFVEHVLAARELLDGDAERRYLDFLARLGPRALGGGGGGPDGRPRDPRLQRRPWGGRGMGGMRGPWGAPPPAEEAAPAPRATPSPSASRTFAG
jgi:hypothetical protein